MNAPFAHQSPRARIASLACDRECARIDGFVTELGGSIFQSPRWLRAVEMGTGQRACGIVVEHLGAIIGWLPLTAISSPLFGRGLVSSGFGVRGGILADHDAGAKSLTRAAEEMAMRMACSSVELRGGTVPQRWTNWADRHANFAGELAADDDAQLLAIPRKQRAEVRKSLNPHLTVTVGNDASDRAAHYTIYCESVHNLGTPVFPRSLFDAMLDSFGDDADILTVLHDGRPVASVLSFYHDGAVMPFWGGGRHAARALRANERMYYELMLHARHRGMTRFDFGRSKTGSGPYHYKKNWGFTPEPITHSLWTAPGHEPRDLDPGDASYARKIALWKRLPLPVANAIGPHIARGLG